MAVETFLDGRVELHGGDCFDVLPLLQDASIDACVTDGPYHMPQMEKRFGSEHSAPAQGRLHGEGANGNARGNGQIYSAICNGVELWEAIYRVLKPGAWLLAFNRPGLPMARMTCAIADAGFEVRGELLWLYGTGFPHGKPLGKLVDRKVLGDYCDEDELARGPVSHSAAFFDDQDITLKPAHEDIVIARKPIDGTIGDNLLKHGTGALNVTECRVQHETGSSWPADVLTDGSAEVRAAFPTDASGHSVSRFFFHPKADDRDRAGSSHPTVKPLAVMEWLVKLVTPPGGTVLDPFAGSGTTGEAAWRCGRRAALIEIKEEFQHDIANRMRLCLAGPEERRRAAIKASNDDKPFEAGSLFASL